MMEKTMNSKLSELMNHFQQLFVSEMAKLRADVDHRISTSQVASPVPSAMHTPSSRRSSLAPLSVAKAELPPDEAPNEESRAEVVCFEHNGKTYKVPKAIQSPTKSMDMFKGILEKKDMPVEFVYVGKKGGFVRYRFDEFGNSQRHSYLSSSEKELFKINSERSPLKFKSNGLFSD
jgi:hypothetical protein